MKRNNNAKPDFRSSGDAWDRVKWNGWGEKGKYYELDDKGVVTLYPSGVQLPKLLSFVKEVVQLEQLDDTPSFEVSDLDIPAPHLNSEFMDEVTSYLHANQINTENMARVSHAFGRSLRDLWRLRRGQVQNAPDVVLFPQSHEDVVKIVNSCHKHNVILIPYGGGSNIVGALEPHDPLSPTTSSSPPNRRTIVSLEMRRMSKMLWLDKKTNTACFEVGCLGPDLEQQLGREGYSLGHDPDSFQWSTLGGWLATLSSGMQSDKYGDIEDMCVSLKVVTPALGTIITPTVPRNGSGLDLKRIFLGSEGSFGVITQAVMKVHKVPPVKEFHGVIMPSWEQGVKCIETIIRNEGGSAMIRLYDPEETKLSFSMKPGAAPGSQTAGQAFGHFFSEQMSNVIKKYLEYGRGFDMNKVCLMLVGFEGEKANVTHQKKQVFKQVKAFEGVWIGQGPGKSWYEKRYDLPLLRDFLMQHGMWVDVAESSMSWQDILKLWKEVKEDVVNAITARGYPGWCGAHISHSYENGVCVYFHYASIVEERNGVIPNGEEGDDLRVYLAAKEAATEAILRNGGALSHHHGVGIEHVPWMERYFGVEGVRLMREIKGIMDPKGVCNPGKVFELVQGDEGKKEDSAGERFLFWSLGLNDKNNGSDNRPSGEAEHGLHNVSGSVGRDFGKARL
eukprot:TRINITY_DN394_c0_g1_i1.p1 TRINITY_DN394_c0_g1~~TRINITY_DN394_c0_g1_i1.p1  ORF type:complete len:673 (-),score=179.69 TRINITY_DN394_c0_g1_i1:36-2054(-)